MSVGPLSAATDDALSEYELALIDAIRRAAASKLSIPNWPQHCTGLCLGDREYLQMLLDGELSDAQRRVLACLGLRSGS